MSQPEPGFSSTLFGTPGWKAWEDLFETFRGILGFGGLEKRLYMFFPTTLSVR